MKYHKNCLQLGLVVLSVAMTANALNLEKVNQKRQVGADKGLVLDSSEDRTAEATGFLGAAAGAVGAHSKYFQDFFTVQLAPHRIEFGHVCEDPNDWEERYERKDFKTHRDQGKVRWGDKHGGYGEHYWDYNHAGHGGDSHDEGSEAVADYEEQNRKKRQPNSAAGPSLVLDPASGQVIDQVSGQKFVLQPIN